MNRLTAAKWAALAAALNVSVGMAHAQAPAQVIPGADPEQTPLAITPRIKPDCPLRLGGVFTSGLAPGPVLANVTEHTGKLSAENRDWIARNCDAAALSPTDIDPDTFPAINKIQKLFTPLLYLYATSAYEGVHRGSIGAWGPEMADWVLRRKDGSEVPFPEPHGHWMDFANLSWASFWTARARDLTGQYSAYGVVTAELPLGNTFVGSDLQKYHTTTERADATRVWLTAVRRAYPNLLVPCATGFDLAAGHSTPEPRIGFVEPSLGPRLWNDYFPISDGAWCEGWVQPYWERLPLSESLWETQMEAADRAGRIGQVFIVGAAYQNVSELEFALASYLLIVHNQGRVVFQPMPIRPNERADAGFSLAVLQREVREKPGYFRIPLGVGMQERHEIPARGGRVWRRNFQFGDVYVNSDERKSVSVLFAGTMKRLSGQLVRRVDLPPHSGVVLLYTSASAARGNSKQGASAPKGSGAKPSHHAR